MIHRRLIMLLFLCWAFIACSADPINVKTFGAKGDGKTDDTKAIQKAIDAAPAGTASVVFFPKGIYILASLTITKNYLENYFLLAHSQLTFSGEGDGSVIKLADHHFDKTDLNANGHLFYGAGVNNVSFENLMIDMNGGNNLVPAKVVKNECAIFMKNGSGLSLKNMTIKNCAGRNMLLVLGTGKNVSVENSRFLNGGWSVGTDKPNNNQVDFSFLYSEWDSTRIINNRIEQQNIEIALNSITGGMELHGSNCYAAGNKIIGCSPGIYISSSWHKVEGTVVEKNELLQCPRGISFWLTNPMDNITIRDNTIQLTNFRKWTAYTSNGIGMPNGNTSVYDGQHANGATITNLTITGITITAADNDNTADRTAGMVLHSLQNSNISNNTIKGMNFGGVILQGSKWGSDGVKVTGNKFFDFKTNYDQVSPAGYVVVYDGYAQLLKTSSGIKNIDVSGNDFQRDNAPAARRQAGAGAKKPGRFAGTLVILPQTDQQQVRFTNNRFSDKSEKMESINLK